MIMNKKPKVEQLFILLTIFTICCIFFVVVGCAGNNSGISLEMAPNADIARCGGGGGGTSMACGIVNDEPYWDCIGGGCLGRGCLTICGVLTPDEATRPNRVQCFAKTNYYRLGFVLQLAIGRSGWLRQNNRFSKYDNKSYMAMFTGGFESCYN
jgi:hypothetical protein